MVDMILASAIKFHIDKTNEDVVLCGLRHSDIFKQLKSLGFEPREGYKEISQGFITDKGKYLDRVDALSYALKYRQITDSKGKTELFSEDLW